MVSNGWLTDWMSHVLMIRYAAQLYWDVINPTPALSRYPELTLNETADFRVGSCQQISSVFVLISNT